MADRVTKVHRASGHSAELLIERGQKQQVQLARVSTPYKRLSIAQNGKVLWNASGGKFAMFQVAERELFLIEHSTFGI